VRLIDDAERRARLGRRHGLAPADRAGDVVQAAERIVCLHGTDPASIFLSAWARCRDMTVGDLEQALYVDRSLVKHLAMRRTLFVFPRDLLGAAQAGASERVADQERRRLIAEVEKAGLRRDGGRWLTKASNAVMDRLAGGREASMRELRDEIPVLDGLLTYGEGRSWGGQFPVAPRVLTTLSAAGRIVRATNDGGWTTSRPRWAAMSDWLGHDLERPTASEGLATLVRRWLHAFGPGTETDLKWWLGSTLTAVRQALLEVEAVEVQLEHGTGYVLPDDVEPAPPAEPWAALLPPLDPTTMGWKERDWYLGPHKDQLFDTNGNAGPTAWWDGRIVGGWCRDEGGGVRLQLLEPVGPDGRRALDAEAERLTHWLDGAPFSPRFPSPLWKIGPGA
jgi:hypothetical protein